MNDNNKKVHEIIGVKITNKELTTTRAGSFAGQKYWKLIVICETAPEIKRVRVLNNKLGTAGEIGAEEIMNDILKSNYADQRYLFYIYKNYPNYDLAGWKLLENKN